MARSFINPENLNFYEAISNAKASRDATDWMGLNDFNIFNPYIHYIPKPPNANLVQNIRAVPINYVFAYSQSAAAVAGKTYSVPPKP